MPATWRDVLEAAFDPPNTLLRRSSKIQEEYDIHRAEMENRYGSLAEALRSSFFGTVSDESSPKNLSNPSDESEASPSFHVTKTSSERSTDASRSRRRRILRSPKLVRNRFPYDVTDDIRHHVLWVPWSPIGSTTVQREEIRKEICRGLCEELLTSPGDERRDPEYVAFENSVRNRSVPELPHLQVFSRPPTRSDKRERTGVEDAPKTAGATSFFSGACSCHRSRTVPASQSEKGVR
jgi:hypothetical protein